jgi:putative ATPase
MSHQPKFADDRPLPERVRPSDLDAVFGQDHIWRSDAPLRKLVESDQFQSLILWGPPGTGKTTIAQLIGRHSCRTLVSLSAVHATVKDLRLAIDQSSEQIASGHKGNILFVDEIHRLSKNQQDALLPGLERGLIRFIGATTENPSFTVNPAILSRSLTFNLRPLDVHALINMMQRALKSNDVLLTQVTIDEKALLMLAQSARGDARQCLNLLAAAAACARPTANGQRFISTDVIEELSLSLPLRYDRDGDQHYDVISAFIKSIRGSHPDAAVYYLARMIESGEDPLFIARRLLISASEDIGNANPTAMLIADATVRAVEVLGLPEARISLAQCTTYLAASPKSNRAYTAINEALDDVRKTGSLDIPKSLRNAPTAFMQSQGFGADYAYPHDNLEKAKKMKYLPPELKGRNYYRPLPVGVERQFIETLKHLRPMED